MTSLKKKKFGKEKVFSDKLQLRTEPGETIMMWRRTVGDGWMQLQTGCGQKRCGGGGQGLYMP